MNTKIVIRVILIGCTLILLLVGLMCFTSAALAHTGVLQSSNTLTPPAVATSPLIPDENRIEAIEAKLQSLEKNIQTQSEAYSATVTRMEANMNLLLAVMAVASLLVAILGFGFVKIWLRQLVEERVQKALSQEVNELAKNEIDKLRREWDPKFASLYDEYRKTISRK